MKEKILKKIRDGLGKTSLSERTLTQYAERRAAKVTTDEGLTDDVVAEWIADLKDIEGQLNHDVAAAAKTSSDKAKELEAELAKLKTGKTVEDGKTGAGNDTPGWFLEFQAKQEAELKTLKEQMDVSRATSELNTFKDGVMKVMRDKGAMRDYFLNTVIGRFQKMESGDTVDSVSERLLTEYDSEVTKALGDGAAPRSTTGGVNDSVAKELDAFFAKKAGVQPEQKK